MCYYCRFLEPVSDFPYLPGPFQARSTALLRSNQAKDRVTTELREGSKILEDQLRLMDEKVNTYMHMTIRSQPNITHACGGDV